MSMLKGDELRAEMSRRAFLSYWVALGAMSIAAPSLLATGARAATPDGEVLNGSHWGVFRAKVEGGRFVSVRPWEKDPAPSHRCRRAGHRLLADPHLVSDGPPGLAGEGSRRRRPRPAARATSCG